MLTVETRMPTNEEWLMIPGEAVQVVGKKYFSHIYHVYTLMITKETNTRTGWTEVQCRGPTYALEATERSFALQCQAYPSGKRRFEHRTKQCPAIYFLNERWRQLRAQDPGHPQRGQNEAGQHREGKHLPLGG